MNNRRINNRRNYISAMCDRSTTINYVPDQGPRRVSGLVPNISPLIKEKKEKRSLIKNNDGRYKWPKRINN